MIALRLKTCEWVAGSIQSWINWPGSHRRLPAEYFDTVGHHSLLYTFIYNCSWIILLLTVIFFPLFRSFRGNKIEVQHPTDDNGQVLFWVEKQNRRPIFLRLLNQRVRCDHIYPENPIPASRLYPSKDDDDDDGIKFVNVLVHFIRLSTFWLPHRISKNPQVVDFLLIFSRLILGVTYLFCQATGIFLKC